MRCLGIDPGPSYFAWAIFDEQGDRYIAHGDCVIDADWRFPHEFHAIACERVHRTVTRRGDKLMSAGASTLQTAEVVGMIRAWASIAGKRIVLLAKPTITSAISGSAKSSDAEVNRSLYQFVRGMPSPGTRGFAQHHRDALAAAYVGPGRIRAQEAMAKVA